jgi:histidinol-phosphatase (PHP family)
MDYHLHTKASPDGAGDLEDFIKEAVRKGIDEIGFSEHLFDRPAHPMGFLDKYVSDFLEIKKNSAIPIRLGAEIDFFPEEIDMVKELLGEYPFDYVIGSVHYLDNWPIDSRSQMQAYFRRDILQVYKDYFEAVRKLCRTRLFDTLGHADIVKIFGFKPDRDITSILKETTEAIASSGMCVEINTAGLIRKCAEIYPSRQLLQMLKDRNVPITLGSDAHRPQDVGRSFDKAFELSKQVGFTHFCIFEARRRSLVEIQDHEPCRRL